MPDKYYNTKGNISFNPPSETVGLRYQQNLLGPHLPFDDKI